MARTVQSTSSNEGAVTPKQARRTPATSALSHGRRGGATSAEILERGSAGAPSEVWQARIGAELAAQLRADAQVLGLAGRTEIVKAALELIHRQAAEQRMAQSVDDFYGGAAPPLPLGVSDGGDGGS